MRSNSSYNKILNISVVALFLSVSFAGCLENNEDEPISSDDVIVNPSILIGGEFQTLVISVKRDVAVFIPHMVVDPSSNYVQNGTVLDMQTGETKQLTILAPPRIDTAFVFLSKYGTEIWPIRNPSESWNSWVERGGINGGSLSVSAFFKATPPTASITFRMSSGLASSPSSLAIYQYLGKNSSPAAL